MFHDRAVLFGSCICTAGGTSRREYVKCTLLSGRDNFHLKEKQWVDIDQFHSGESTIRCPSLRDLTLHMQQPNM